MEFTISMGVGGFIVLVVGALIIGVVLQFVGDVRFGYEWLLTSLGAFVGGLIASEWIVSLSTVEPVWDGLALVPALIGGLIGGVLVDLVTRFATGGSLLHGPHAV